MQLKPLGSVNLESNFIPLEQLRQLLQDYERLYYGESLTVKIETSLFPDGSVNDVKLVFLTSGRKK